MRLSIPSAASAKAGVSAVVKWFAVGGLLVGLIMAVVQWRIATHEAHVATIQTYNMGRIAAFRDSGAELDREVATFADAAAEGRALTEPKQAVRRALADHASKAIAMSDAFGQAPTNAYVSDLKALQTAVEATDNRLTPGPIITALSRVVVSRNRLADAATKKATA